MSPLHYIAAQTRLDTHVPSYMVPAGSPARTEATLGWALTITAIAVTVIVAVVLVVAITRNHSSHVTHAAEDGRHSTREGVVSGLSWIYIGLALTVVILLVAFGGTVVAIGRTAHIPDHPGLTLDVTAHQWWWEVRVEDSIPSDAFVTANEIHVPVGVPIRIRVQSQDVIHSFWVPELFGKIDVIPGQLNEAWLNVDKPGVYRGACAEYCGLQHAHMAFAITAEPLAAFNQWAQQQRKESAVSSAPNTTLPPEVSRGQAVFVTNCSGCHAVRGTDALGRLGPDLTHLASRQTIGAGLVDNTPDNLMKWVTNAQAVKPGVLMPRMDLRHADIAAVVAYLNTLH